MFAEDPAATFDFTQATRRPNRFQALAPAKDVTAFVDGANRYFEFLARCSPQQLAAIAQGCDPEHERLLENHLVRLHAVWMSQLKPAHRCFCGSGRKFFRCHQSVPPLDRFLQDRRLRASWVLDREASVVKPRSAAALSPANLSQYQCTRPS